MFKKLITNRLVKVLNWLNRSEHYADANMKMPAEVNRIGTANTWVGKISTKFDNSNHDLRDTGSSYISLVLYQADGGIILQHNCYDPNMGMTTTKLYVIHNNEDIGEEIGQILTREILSR